MTDVRALLERAMLDGSPLDPVLEAIDRGEAKLWTGDHSAAVTQMVKVMDLPLAAGNLPELLDMLTQAEIEAREQGCNRIECTGRAGWPRVLPGYRTLTIYVKDLT